MDARAENGDSRDDCTARFLRAGVLANAADAARTRREFGAWLREHFQLDDERFNDVLLAVYEALANATEYAYSGAADRGTLDVTADYARQSRALVVNVVDHGRWRMPSPEPTAVRGRGIPLMRALADSTSVNGTAHGTGVTMTWLNMAPASPA